MSSVGKKLVMAVTGALMLAFLTAHVAGNLKIFAGAAAFDAYARWLHSYEPLLWVQRAGLLAAVGLHIWAAASLARRAEPGRGWRGIAGAMRWGGLILAGFVVFHVATVTGRYDALVADLRRWWVAGIYLAAVAVLGVHLWHGVFSGLMTVGRPLPRAAGAGAAALICAGFASVPVAIAAGWVR